MTAAISGSLNGLRRFDAGGDSLANNGRKNRVEPILF